MSEATPDLMPDVGITREQAVESCRSSMDFFAAICVPEIFKFLYPPIFKAIWQLLTSAALEQVGKKRLAIGIPRGFGKTMVLKLFVAWCIAFTNRKFILVVCNTSGLAENFIADVADILSSLNYLRVFGDWRMTLEKDTQELKKFSFKGRTVILAGLGAGSSLRGLNIKFVRPDLILQDDMQSREEAGSPVESVKNLSWMLGTLMKANDNQRCLHVFVGNMYPYEGSILRKLKTNPAWISFITGAILEDGESLWPELRTVEDILTELENDESMGHPEIFYSEVMNDEVAGSRSGVDFSKINMWQGSDEELLNSPAGFVIIDPSLGKKKSDDVVIMACLIYNGEPVAREISSGKFNPGQQVTEAIRLAMKYGLTAIVVESVAYQASLCYWIDQKKLQLGLTALRVLEINPQGRQKVMRIIEMLKQLTAQKDRIILHPVVRSQVTHQITYFDPLKKNNTDDVLDMLAYLWQVIKTHGYLVLRPFEMMEEESQASFSDDLQLEF
jgi:hypothetical protein